MPGDVVASFVEPVARFPHAAADHDDVVGQMGAGRDIGGDAGTDQDTWTPGHLDTWA